MAQTIALSLTLKNGGAIDGGGASGVAKAIAVTSFDWPVTTPRETGTGRLTGLPTLGPIIFCKNIDKSSAPLMQGLTGNDFITKAQFQFFRPTQDGSGGTENYYTVEIDSGQIATIEANSANSLDVTQEHSSAPQETISLVYQNFTITYNSADGKNISTSYPKSSS